MADDLARDLDAISVPSIPNDYASLKALIQTLPSPLSPEIRSAASGLAAGGADPSMAGSTSLTTSSSPLAGSPVGMESGAGMGRYPELFYGQSNALVDPTFEKLPLWTYPTALVEGVWTACGPSWEGRKTLTSGANPVVTIGMGADREWASRDYGSGSSALGHITVTPAAAACVSVIELRTTQGWSPRTDSTLLTNIVNAVRACSYNGGAAGFSYVVEVLLTGDADVVRASSSMTSATLGTGSLFRRLWCSYAGSPAVLTSEIWHFVVRLTVTYTSTFSPIQGIYLSEPQMSFSTTELPPPFTPLVAGWTPRELDGRTARIEPIDAASSYMGWWDVRGDLPATESALRLRLAADTHGRVVVGLASAFGSGIGFGPGGADNIDVALHRQAAGTLKVASLGAANDALQIGDDSILFDVDIGDRLGICGQTAGAPNANGGFVFGSGKDTNLYRNAANSLKTDDAFEIGGVIKATGGLMLPPAGLIAVPEQGQIEMDTNALYATTDAGNRGVIPVRHFIRADATRTFANNGNSQAIFTSPANGRITLETGLYRVTGLLQLGTMSTTSGNLLLNLLGAGDAVVAAWLWHAWGGDRATATAAAVGGSTAITSSSPASVVTGGAAAAVTIGLDGTFEVTGAGTMIPSITLVTAAAAVLAIGSFLTFERMGATNVVSVGQWD